MLKASDMLWGLLARDSDKAQLSKDSGGGLKGKEFIIDNFMPVREKIYVLVTLCEYTLEKGCWLPKNPKWMDSAQGRWGQGNRW